MTTLSNKNFGTASRLVAQQNKEVATSNVVMAEAKEKTQLWLNIGITAPDGSVVNLPVGIPLDNMKLRQVYDLQPDATEDQIKARKAIAAGNRLAEILQNTASHLAAGETTVVEKDFTISLYRIKEHDNTGSDIQTDELDKMLGF